MFAHHNAATAGQSVSLKKLLIGTSALPATAFGLMMAFAVDANAGAVTLPDPTVYVGVSAGGPTNSTSFNGPIGSSGAEVSTSSEGVYSGGATATAHISPSPNVYAKATGIANSYASLDYDFEISGLANVSVPFTLTGEAIVVSNIKGYYLAQNLDAGVGVAFGTSAFLGLGFGLGTTPFDLHGMAVSDEPYTINVFTHPQRADHPDRIIGTPASAARRASSAVSPCKRPVAITLAAAA